MDRDTVINLIRNAFSANAYPGDHFLQGSFDGCEPAEDVGAFVGKTDWSVLDSAMLDARYCALSFFSEAGFRFFLPAYLIADLREELQTADPLFHLWHGFATVSAEIDAGDQKVLRTTGGANLLNPNRYGAMTWLDHARHRMSIFAREEAQAIVSYLQYKSEQDKIGFDKPKIDAALAGFWLDRAKTAPTLRELASHLEREEKFTTQILRAREENS
jgi:hypothetical protein